MKRFLSLTLCLAMVAAAGSAFASKGTVERDLGDLQVVASEDANAVLTSSSSNAGQLGRYADSTGDTFFLYGGPLATTGKFGSGPGGLTPDRQGWIGLDNTDNPIFWQVSTYNAANLGAAGNNAFWCGRSLAQAPDWTTAPGYGNSWNDVALYEFAVANPAAGQNVTLDFFFNHDSEPLYDFFYVEYDSAGTWVETLQLDGTNGPGGVFPAPGVQYSSVATGSIVYAGNDYGTDNTLRIRFRFQSDGAWSDQDGLWPTNGAVQMDNVSITHAGGNFSENFEGAGPYLIFPDKAPFAGDFSDVWPAMTDLDPCRDNDTPTIGFIDNGDPPSNGPGVDGTVSTGGSTSTNWDYGVTGGWVTNYTGGISNGAVDIDNVVISPEIAWNDPTTALDDGDIELAGSYIGFTVWTHLPLSNGIFYVWGVRSKVAGDNYTAWRDRNFVYYGGGVPAWGNVVQDVTDLIVNNPATVQMQLGVIDLAALFGFPGNDATPSPMFDNARFVKYRVAGPSFATRAIDTANDGFPANGSVDASTQAARNALNIPFDMARDIVGDINDAVNIPGDSVIVDVTAVIPGTTVTDIRMKWALRKNPFFEDAIRQAPARVKDQNVVAPVPGQIWTGEVVADTSKTSNGNIVARRYFVDLPDVNFLYPGDQLHYYIEATDSGGRTTTLPADTSGFGVWTANGQSSYNRAWTVRGLPSISGWDPLANSGNGAPIQPEKLVWVDAGRGVDNNVLSIMGQLGFVEGADYDVYTTQGPTSGVSNGLGSAGAHGANPGQLFSYDTIIVLHEGLSTFLLSNGSNAGNNDKGNDIGVLDGWKALPGQRNTVHFGDYVASGISADSGEGATYVQTTLGIQLNGNDVRAAIGNQTAPEVEGNLAAFDTPFVAFGGCLAINQFDDIAPIVGAVAGHSFLSTGGVPYAGSAASVVYDRTDLQGDRKVDITFPYALDVVYGTVGVNYGAGLGVQSRLWEDIFTYLGVAASGPNVTSAPQVIKPELAIVPNPFNPKTTVKFAMPTRGDATVKVYNLRGELVRTLHTGALEAGEHPFVWDGTDNDGRSVSSGVYLVNAITTGFNATKKAVLVK